MLALLSCVGVVIASTRPAAAVAPIDACTTTTSYLSQDIPTQLYAGTYSAGAVSFATVGSATVNYNAMGFNTVDHYLYAIQKTTQHVLRINPTTGAATDLGATSPATPSTVVGAFDDSGSFYTESTSPATLTKIDVNALTGTSVSLSTNPGINDFTYADGYLWAAKNSGNAGVRIDPVTGTVLAIALPGLPADTFGAAYTLGNGDLVFGSNSGLGVFQYSVSNPTGSSPTLALVSTRDAPASGTNDGTACLSSATDLSTSVTAAATVQAGATLTWTVSVTNNGTSPSSGFVLTDAVPTDYTNVASSTSGCSVSGNAVTCGSGSLAPGATQTFTITATAPTGAGCLSNSATVAGNEVDPTAGNNSDSVSTCVIAPLDVSTSFSPTTIDAGDTSTVTVTLTNPNASAVSGAAFTDTYPAAMSNASPAGASTTCSAATVSATAGGTTLAVSGASLPGNSSCTITASVTVPLSDSSAGDYVNTIAAGAVTTAGTPANASAASATLTVRAPSLTLTKTAGQQTVGVSSSYTLRIGNAGNEASGTTLVVADQLPAGSLATGVSAGSDVSAADCGSLPSAAAALLTCTLTLTSALSAGAADGTAQLTISTTPQADVARSVTNYASIDVVGLATPPAPGPSCVTANCAQVTSDVGNGVALSLVKTNPARLVVGFASSYAFTVTNSGTGPAASATVVDRLPADLGYTSASGASCAVTAGTVSIGQTVSCTVTPTLPIAAVGGTAGFSVDVTPVAAHLAVVNRAAVDSSGGTSPFDATNCVGTASPDPGCAVTAGLAVHADVVSPPAPFVTTALNTAVTSIDVQTGTTTSQNEPLDDPTITAQGTHGTAAVNVDGTLSYLPDTDFSGVDTVSYQLCDTGIPASCATATVTVTVTNAFIDGPATTGVSTPENTPTTSSLTDLLTTDGAAVDPTSVAQATAPVHGTLSIDLASGAVTYSPDTGYSGPDSYQLNVCDTSLPAQCATVTVSISVSVETVTAVDETASTVTGVATGAIAVKADASSVSAPLANPTIPAAPAHGSATVGSDGSVVYTPNAHFSGVDVFGYSICDTSPTPVCDAGTITVTVSNVFTDGAAASGVSTPQNTAITSTLAQLVGVDGAPLDATSVTQSSAPAHGTLTVDAGSGAVTYTPAAGYSGADSYAVRVCDSSAPQQCHHLTIPVTVGVNAVSALDKSAATTAVTPTDPIAVTAGATTAGQPLAAATVPVQPAHGTATITGAGSVIYTPAAHFSGTEVFGYRICDTSIPAPVCVDRTITVLVANTFRDGVASAGESTGQNAPLTSSLARLVITLGAPIGSRQVTVQHSPEHGAVSVDGSTGAVTYTPHAGYSGPDSYVMHLCDTSTPTRQCHDVTVPVTVEPDVVVIPDEHRTIAVDSSTAPIDVLVASRSVSGQPLDRPVISTAPGHGDATINPNGTITYLPDAGFRGTDRFKYTVCDTGNPPVCDVATVVVEVTSIADLAVSDVLAQRSVIAGEQLHWTVRVTNHGPATAAGMHGLDLIPASVSAASGTPDRHADGASCSARPTTSADLQLFGSTRSALTIAEYPTIVDCRYPRLRSGASVQSDISGTLRADAAPGTPVLNEATALSDTFDPKLSNNHSSTWSTSTADADLVLTKTAERSSVAVGDHDTFTVTLHNNGPSVAADIDVDDTPIGMSYVSSSTSTGTFSAARGSWHVDSLTPGATATLVVVEKITAVTAGNVARIIHSDATDPVSSNNGGAQCVAGETGCGSVHLNVTATSTASASTLALTGVDSLALLRVALLAAAGGVVVAAAGRRRRSRRSA